MKCGTTLYVSVTRMVARVGINRRTETVRRFVAEPLDQMRFEDLRVGVRDHYRV
jgi:hypothetical protein